MAKIKPISVLLRIALITAGVFVPYYLGYLAVWILQLDPKYILITDMYAGGVVVALMLVVIPYALYAFFKWLIFGLLD